MKHIMKLSAIVLSVFIIEFFIERSIDIFSTDPVSFERTIEILSEFFSIFVAFSIFSMTWHAYSNSKDNHSLFLGAAFSVIGLTTLFHLLSYPFMPDFVTSNSLNKADFFFIESRILLSLSFLTSSYIYKDTVSIKRFFLIPLIIVTSVISIFVSLSEPIFPVSSFRLVDPAGTVLIFFISVILLFSTYRYIIRLRETGQNNLELLIYGMIILIFSNIVYRSYELSAHFLIIIGFFFIYMSLYKSSVELPYSKLALAEDRFHSLRQSINDAMISIDMNGKIIFWNNGSQKMFGYRENEVMGKDITILMPERYREFHKEGMSRLLSKRDPDIIEKTIEMHGLRKDGSEFPLELSLSTWKDVESRFFGSIIRDITERKHIEEIHIENERLIYANKAKSDFLTIMSHELRTPLNSIIGFSELLKKKKNASLTVKQERYVDNVLTNGINLLSLIDDILDLSFIEAGKIKINKETMPVQKTIHEIINLVEYKALEQKVILKAECDPELETVEADIQRIKQILLNLLNNAVKFSKKEGGIVTIITKKEDNKALFSIVDTGIGIKDEDLVKLFNTFSQVDSGSSRKYGGTGLGLVISKHLAQLHGGQIVVKSKLGEGSAFTLILPINQNKMTTSQKALEM
ncbi:MAG: PAS domain S-box protein [Candidatus Methanoperedens sp.]|nr:PAS domain S-box protein [Candidatus Methanoperedens sp.]